MLYRVFTQEEPIVRVNKDTSAIAAANLEAAALMQRVYTLAATGTFGVHWFSCSSDVSL